MLTSKLKQTAKKNNHFPTFVSCKRTLFETISCSLLSADYCELYFWFHNSQTNNDNQMFFYSWQMCSPFTCHAQSSSTFLNGIRLLICSFLVFRLRRIFVFFGHKFVAVNFNICKKGTWLIYYFIGPSTNSCTNKSRRSKKKYDYILFFVVLWDGLGLKFGLTYVWTK